MISKLGNESLLSKDPTGNQGRHDIHSWTWQKPCAALLLTIEVIPVQMSFYTGFRILAEKAMAPHSSTLARKIPWTEEPGRLQPMGLQRVRHDWATSLSLFTFMHWRRKQQPTPVFLPGESQGWWSLVGCRLWGCTESDMTKWLSSSSSRRILTFWKPWNWQESYSSWNITRSM